MEKSNQNMGSPNQKETKKLPTIESSGLAAEKKISVLIGLG